MSKLRDCIYGQAVGDALGVPFEGSVRDTFKCADMVGFGTHHKKAGTWSDDTSMTLAIVDSYKHLHKVDAADIRAKFNSWYREGAYTCDGTFSVGQTTMLALESGEGLSDEMSNGNGSLMRTIALAFTDATDEEIALVSAITHAHNVSKQACVDMVHVARALIRGEKPTSVVENVGIDYKKDRSGIYSSGYVLHTFEASLYCLANTSNYKDCVVSAVNLGDDTDTTAAVAGALAGIVYGIDAIPLNWIESLRGKDIIEKCLF